MLRSEAFAVKAAIALASIAGIMETIVAILPVAIAPTDFLICLEIFHLNKLLEFFDAIIAQKHGKKPAAGDFFIIPAKFR